MRARTPKRVIAAYNALFIFGVLVLLSGCTLLVFAFGWYSLGPEMSDGHSWAHRTCLVTNQRPDKSTTPYGPRVRVVFEVSLRNTTIRNVAATTRLDAWVTGEEAAQEEARYAIGNSTACFCPTGAINVYFPEDHWSIYRFCLFEIREDEIEMLLFYFRMWFYGGIVALVVGPLCMLVPIFVWAKTKCFKRPLPQCCGSTGYSALN